MKSIYLAAPLFNQQERDFNKFIKESLKSHFNVFLPQEDGLLLETLLNDGMDLHTAEKKIFSADVNAMKSSDILLAILDGACIDEGVAFEIGYMKALNKQCIGLQTDIRRQLPSGNNPMINTSLDQYFNDVDKMLIWLKSLTHT